MSYVGTAGFVSYLSIPMLRRARQPADMTRIGALIRCPADAARLSTAAHGVCCGAGAGTKAASSSSSSGHGQSEGHGQILDTLMLDSFRWKVVCQAVDGLGGDLQAAFFIW
jgi:hypothetical protein